MVTETWFAPALAWMPSLEVSVQCGVPLSGIAFYSLPQPTVAYRAARGWIGYHRLVSVTNQLP